MPALAHIQAATLERFVDAWKRWNADDMLATFSDDFTQATFPFRLGLPDKERDAVEQIFPKLVRLVNDYKLTIHETLHDSKKNKAVVYGISTGKTPFGPWEMEYAAFLTFNEAGDRIVRLEEMLDSAMMEQFAPKFQQYLREQKST